VVAPHLNVKARPGTGRPGLVALANTTVKTLTKNQQQKNQKLKSKHNQIELNCNPIGATSAQPEQELETLSGYESYYKQLSEEVETVEHHVRELRQTPGLEDLSEEEAQLQVDFMLRFSAWVFNQHLKN
jgi:cell division protein FtsB